MLLLRDPQPTALGRALDSALRIAVFFGVASLFLEYGFFVSAEILSLLYSIDVGVVSVFILHVLLKWLIARDKKKYARHYWLEITLVVLFLMQIVVTYLAAPAFIRNTLGSLHIGLMTKIYIVTLQIYLVLHLLLGFARLNARIASLTMKPAAILLASYIFLILLGALFLMLPKAAASVEKPVTLLDAFFTATSATCVTGLTIRDTGADFSTTGQMMIIFLIQIGGLGLVTFTMFFSLIQQRSLGVRQTVVLRDILSYDIIGKLGKFLVYVFVITLCVEAVGAAVLYQLWQEPGLGVAERLKWSVFHSISAFCNAGFSIRSESVMGLSGNPGILIIIMMLIVLGGMGCRKGRPRGCRLPRRHRLGRSDCPARDHRAERFGRYSGRSGQNGCRTAENH